MRLLDPDIKNLRIYEYTECSCIIQNATQNREHIRDCLGRKTGFILFSVQFKVFAKLPYHFFCDLLDFYCLESGFGAVEAALVAQ